jgi:adenine-specific DNA-methyltransferase
MGITGLFDNPKPVELISQLIEYSQSGEKDDIILDFFAGSGTTAHAVMESNKKDKGKRSFICIQLPELIDEKSPALAAGYKTIADLSKERIRRAGKKIEEEQNDQLDFNSEGKLDLGFKVFKLSSSNFKVWEGDVEQVENLEQQLFDHVDHINDASSPEDILYELLLKSGFTLSTQVEKLQLAGKDVFSIAEGALLICLEKELTQEVIDAIADADPLQVICLDDGFKGNDQLKANAVQTFKARAQEDKDHEIVFRTV